MPRMVFLSLFLLVSCIEGANQSHMLAERSVVELSAFQSIINQRDFQSEKDLIHNEDVSIINADYPVEIWLYRNNKYYYDLPNLGSGIGEWSYKNGLLHLENIHHVKTINFNIEMNYEVFYSKEKELKVFFNDRFGGNSLVLERKN